MSNIITVLRLLWSYENVLNSKILSEADKKVAARDILRSIPPEIMAPDVAETANVLKEAIKKYLGVESGRTEKPKAESPIIAEPDAATSPKEPEATGVVGGPRVASGASGAKPTAHPRKGKAGRGS